MKRTFDYDVKGASFAAGMKTAIAAMFVGLLVALGLGFAPTAPLEQHPENAPSAAAAAVPDNATTVYFPSQYPLNATEPAEHVQAF